MNNIPKITEPTYVLTSNKIITLTADLLRERASIIPKEFSDVVIEVCGNSEYANIGRYVERVVFEESFGNDSTQMVEEYGHYEMCSRFFLSIDIVSKKPIGVLRIIGNSVEGLKSLNDANNIPFNVCLEDVIRYHEKINNLDTVWDIGTVAKLPEYKLDRRLTIVKLYRAVYLASLKRGINHWISIIDDSLLQMILDRFGIPFVALADSKPGPYLGSEKSHAVYSFVPDFYEKMGSHMRNNKGHLGKLIFELLVNGSEDESIFI